MEGVRAAVAPQAVGLEVRVDDTRAALRRWAHAPASTVLPWVAGSFLIGALLLAGALLVANLSVPGVDPYTPVFADPTAGIADALRIFARNTLVLALYSLVCVAMYLATRPAPLRASRLQERAGPLAACVIAGLTVYSVISQIWTLGHALASAAHTLGLTDAGLLARLTVHAAPELTALFLPLAACITLMRGAREDDLVAAGLLCFAVALPVVAACAFIETFLTRSFV
jgi:hypothetical protein